MRVFLCHSHADKPEVSKIARWLSPYVDKVWLDDWELAPGDSLYERIARELESTDRCLIFISQNSINSLWVQKELNLILGREDAASLPLAIPVMLDQTNPTGFLRDRIQARLLDGEAVALSSILRGIYRDRSTILVTLDHDKPFTVSRDSIERTITTLSRAPEAIPPNVVIDSFGFLGAVEWALKDATHWVGDELDAREVVQYTDWFESVFVNLSLVAGAILRYLAPRGAAVMDYRHDLEEVWNRLIRLVLLRVPGFNIIRRLASILPPEHSYYRKWFEWAYERLGVSRTWEEVVSASLGVDLGDLVELDLLAHDDRSIGYPIVWVSQRHILSFHKLLSGSRLPIFELALVWIPECLPQVAARLVFDAAHKGISIRKEWFAKLEEESYREVGLH